MHCITQPVPLYLVHPGLLYAGAQVLHAGMDVPLGLQLGFHARQVGSPLCPLQSHLKQAKGSGQLSSSAGASLIGHEGKKTFQVTQDGTNIVPVLAEGPKPVLQH